MSRRLSPVLVRASCFGMLLLANHAMASYIYRMVDAQCTDSNHVIKYFPDGEGNLIEGAGPKACANHVSIEVKMRGDYVPGTEFSWNWMVGNQANDTPPPVESFVYDDRARRFSFSFTTPPSVTAMAGMLPDRGVQRSTFWINTNGWGFFANPDGTWRMSVEGATGPDAPCNLGSTEGPNGCRMASWGYDGVGSYRGWHRIPEPATSMLLLSSLGWLAFVARRRKHR